MENFVAAMAVKTDCGRGEQHFRRAVELRQRFAKELRAKNAAVANLLFLFVRPAPGVQAFARQMNDGIEPFQRGDLNAPLLGLPGNRIFQAAKRAAN